VQRAYPEEVESVLNVAQPRQYRDLVADINGNKRLKLVLIQHEFGLFEANGETDFLQFIYSLTKPIALVFHTVLPKPDSILRAKVRNIAAACASIVVMTNNSADVLMRDYDLPTDKISVIEHGTHLVPHLNKAFLKEKYGLTGKKVLSTFGLLSSGKSLETTLNALPAIIEKNPDVVFLIIGKTHSGVVRTEGEQYREMLQNTVKTLQLDRHVRFVNQYLRLEDLLEYLQLTDIYLFTSKDPNQAVSGTFSYAMSCGCPIISTPIPHALEVLTKDTGIVFDFENTPQLAAAVNLLLGDETLRKTLSLNALHRIAPTAWENSAIAHAFLIKKILTETEGDTAASTSTPSVFNAPKNMELTYKMPPVNLAHVKKMTTDFAMIQFCQINQPDIETGYTLDDNARAAIAVCMHYAATGDADDLPLLHKYVHFMHFCQQPEGHFLNYVDKEFTFTQQNYETNLSDSNGRVLWALGYLMSHKKRLPKDLIETIDAVFQRALGSVETMHSTRAMAFVIKGLYYYSLDNKAFMYQSLVSLLADRLVQMYRHESSDDWQWYESYLTYGNSLLPEALLCAYLTTETPVYKEIAKKTFDFLLSLTFNADQIKVISNQGWLQKGETANEYGEQPIDVAYTILALHMFHKVFKEPVYAQKMTTAFNWFLGNNHLQQIIYNPLTGGCYDGLEATCVNLNQGAESTVSYLMARLTMDKMARARA
jgi:glycosyltransferase involved in cell wall biosynthesis